MLSIKHQTFNILNKYIKFNGIENLNLNDITNCDFVSDDKKRNISFLNNYKSSEKSLLNCPSPITINRNSNSNLIPMFNNNIQNNNYIFNNQNPNNYFSNKSSKNILEQENSSTQQPAGDLHFAQLLTLMANGKQNKNNSNNNNSSLNNSDNLNTNNSINSNINNNYLSNKNVNEIKDNSRPLASNAFNEIQKTNQTNEEGKTLIIQKSSEILLPTLNCVFNDNKVENIKVKMKKSKQKEKRRKIFSLGKKTAKLFNNKNYSIILLDKDNDEFIELENNNSDIIKKKINNDVINKISSNLTLNQNKILLDNIPEISTDDDEFSIHQFDNADLSKEGVITFTLNALYKNINIHTNLKYSQNKVYQEKTLNYLTKLMDNKTGITSNLSNSKISKSSSFSISLTSKIRPVSFNSIDKSIQNSSFHNKILSNKKFDDLLKLSENEWQSNDYKSEGLYETKKRKFKNKNKNNNRLKIDSSRFSRIYSDFNNKKSGITNKSNNNLILIKNKPSKKSKKNTRNSKNGNNIPFTIKIDSANDNLSNNSVNPKKKNTNKLGLGLFEIKKKFKKKNSVFVDSENIINLKTLKNSKTFKISDIKKSQLTENKSTIKNKFTKRRSNKARIGFKLDNIVKDKNEEVNKSFDYLAKEERNENECKII